ncbi:MAG TPA: glycosyltransferase family 4 protein [Gaiellaceae bacterium]|nr:glycosyltransferase family 4 protein [Gaiellaceae bacterium]
MSLRIAVCRPQVPFVYGGAEVVADQLVDELRARGHEVELVAIPYAWEGAHVLDQALLWRLIDLTGTPKPVELVIGTKFPSYGIRHPNKVVWLVHQFRQAYDFDRTEFRQFSESPGDRATKLAIERFDRVALGEARKIFTISANVAERLKRYSGFEATVLPPPPQKLAYRTESYDDFVLSVNRLDRYKRIDLLIEAAKADPALRIVIVGDGPDRERLEQLAAGVNGRIRFTGRIDGGELVDLYARCLAVYYAPVDEDYGMVPYEAFLSAKPVVTTLDAGGPLEVVHDGETGLVVAPEPIELAKACAFLAGHVDRARSLGEAGKVVAEQITWDACIDALLS